MFGSFFLGGGAESFEFGNLHRSILELYYQYATYFQNILTAKFGSFSGSFEPFLRFEKVEGYFLLIQPQHDIKVSKRDSVCRQK